MRLIALSLFSVLAWGQALHVTGAHTSPTYSVATSGSLPTTGCSINEIAVVGPATLSPSLWVNSGVGSCVWTQASSTGAVASVTAGGSGGLACSPTTGTVVCDVQSVVLPFLAGANAWTGANNFLGASKTAPNRSGTGSPNGRDNCTTAGETYFQTDATAGSNIWACTAAGTPGTWTLEGAGSSPAAFSVAWFPFGGAISASLLALGTVNQVNYTEFPVWQKIIVNSITAQSTVGSGPHLAWGLYDSGCNLLGGSTTVAAQSYAFQTWTFASPVTLVPGKYFLGWTSENATASLAPGTVDTGGNGSGGALLNGSDTGSSSHVFSGSNPSTGTTTLAFPATCGTRAVLNTPSTYYIPAVAIR